MDDATDPFAELTRRGHLLFGAAVQAWQEATRSVLDAAGHPDRGSPDLRRSIDAAFDFANQMLAEQQEFARAVMSLGAQAFPSSGHRPAPEPEPAPTAARGVDAPAAPEVTEAPRKAARSPRKATAQQRTTTTGASGAAPRKRTPRKRAAAPPASAPQGPEPTPG
jgi:hypothetical protein